MTYEEKDTEPDFHEGTVQTLNLLSVGWAEAFYLAKSKFNIPESFSFPGNKGPKKQTIIQKDKKENVWSSQLFISRNEMVLDTIQYDWRIEAMGSFLIITMPNKTTTKIEYIGFVD